MPPIPPKRKPKPYDPSQPLEPRRERFAIAIANGAKLQDAQRIAGFEGKSQAAAWQLRHAPDIDARVKAILNERVKAETRSYGRRQKKAGDLLARVVAELEDIAFQDIREVVDWRREPVTNADGEVTGISESVAIRDSKSLTPQAARAIKGIMMKAGRVQVEMHDKRAALEALAKILKGDDIQAASNITVNQVNVGAVDAATAAQRVAFLLSAAAHVRPVQAAPMRVIEGEPSKS